MVRIKVDYELEPDPDAGKITGVQLVMTTGTRMLPYKVEAIPTKNQCKLCSAIPEPRTDLA